ncbi:helix-turn-helix domain-containing protein [Streptomyces sp. NPDC058891]|uniref:helix-turn-helix domain-containing protein n=1 Tax=Streptomyces sp. NPDC058891 TaxID=3346667 RepID=UPI0036C5C0BA
MNAAQPETAAMKFGRLVEQLADEAGYDMGRGGNGRAKLAEATGMSVSAIGRMLRGETLPGPHQYQHIATAVNTSTNDLLIEVGILPREDHTDGAKVEVRSQNRPISPEMAADLLGVSEPTIRRMLIPSMEQAQRLQRDFDRRSSGGTAMARG